MSTVSIAHDALLRRPQQDIFLSVLPRWIDLPHQNKEPYLLEEGKLGAVAMLSEAKEVGEVAQGCIDRE